MSPKNEDTLVLVADDEPSMLALLSAYIRSKGYRVLEASDGDMAWQLAHEHLPHAVVLDVMMPGMSGWEVCKKIRESVSLAHTGVVMLTGIGESLNELTSPLYGADAYIDKPFEFAELEARIRETLERRRAGTLGRPDGGSDDDGDDEEVEKGGAGLDTDADDADDDDDDAESSRAGGFGFDEDPVTQRLARKSGRKKVKASRKAAESKEPESADDEEAPPPRAAKKRGGKKAGKKAAGKKKAAKKVGKKAGKRTGKKAAGKKKAAKKVGKKAVGKKKAAKKAGKKAVGKKKAAKKAGKKTAGKKKAKKRGRR